MKTYACVYFGAALVAMFAVPVCVRLAKRFHLMDAPGVRKVHKQPVPRIGGLVFVLSVLLLVVPVFLLDNVIGKAFREVQPQLVTLLAAGVFIFLIGLLDDIRAVSAPVKLLSLLGAGLAVCLSGARIETVTIGNWFTLSFGWLSWPVTLAWIAGVTVGMNFIDGLDGLAAGIAAIVCGTIAIFAYDSGQVAMLVLLLALLGGLTGFLFFNFNPAKIFMGDGGSMFIGFMVGAGSVVCQAKSATLVGIALPALALGVPLLDTALTMIRRSVLDRRSIFAAERGHIHHRLLARGLRHRTVVVVIYGVTLVAAGMGTLMLTTRQGAQIALLVGGVFFLFVVFVLAGSTRLRETLTAVRHNMAAARERKEERSCFDDAQLRIREAESFQAWWEAVCFMARRLDFDRLTLSGGNGGEPLDALTWRRTPDPLPAAEQISFAIPVNHGKLGSYSRMEVAVRVNGSLETTGRRLTLFGRLLDERNAPADFARVEARRPVQMSLFGRVEAEPRPAGAPAER